MSVNYIQLLVWLTLTACSYLSALREATDRQIEKDRLKRLQLEAAKSKELQQERQQLQQWQENLPPKSEGETQQQQSNLEQGDESDYENSDDEAFPSQQVQQEPEHEGTMADHPDYHSKGWCAAKAAAASSQMSAPVISSVKDTWERQESSGHELPLGDSRGAATSNSRGLSSSPDSSDMPFLQAGLHAEGVNSSENCMQLQQEDGQVGACGMLNSILTGTTSSSGNRENATSSDAAAPLLQEVRTVLNRADASASALHRASSSGRSCDSSMSNPSAVGAEHGVAAASPPAAVHEALPAPVRARMGPVPVGFTQLETPHLPARETRELEIKALKKAQKCKVRDSFLSGIFVKSLQL
jgi:hypothetical protein